MQNTVRIFLFIYTILFLLLDICLPWGDNYVRTIANKRMQGNTHVKLKRWAIAYCLMDCSNEKQLCTSVNYNHAQQICELNGVGESSQKLTSQQGWTFYEKEYFLFIILLSSLFNII